MGNSMSCLSDQKQCNSSERTHWSCICTNFNHQTPLPHPIFFKVSNFVRYYRMLQEQLPLSPNSSELISSHWQAGDVETICLEKFISVMQTVCQHQETGFPGRRANFVLGVPVNATLVKITKSYDCVGLWCWILQIHFVFRLWADLSFIS